MSLCVCEVSRSASEYDGRIKEKQAQHGVSGVICIVVFSKPCNS